MIKYIRKQEVSKTPKQELAERGMNMNTITYFEMLRHTAKTVAKEDSESAKFIGADRSLETLDNAEVDAFTVIVHDGSKAAERVLKASYAFAADPRVEASVDTPIIDNSSWRSITYHYTDEFEDQKIECYAVIVLTRKEVIA